MMLTTKLVSGHLSGRLRNPYKQQWELFITNSSHSLQATVVTVHARILLLRPAVLTGQRPVVATRDLTAMLVTALLSCRPFGLP
jgi:hypothetical protein